MINYKCEVCNQNKSFPVRNKNALGTYQCADCTKLFNRTDRQLKANIRSANSLKKPHRLDAAVKYIHQLDN